MTGTHAETPARSIEAGHRPAAVLALLVAIVAAATITLIGTAPREGRDTSTTPSLERLGELASIYDGQQFGHVPAPATDNVDLERLRELASIYDGQQFGYVPPAWTAPSLERLRELASIYDGQQFGPVPLDD